MRLASLCSKRIPPALVVALTAGAGCGDDGAVEPDAATSQDADSQPADAAAADAGGEDVSIAFEAMVGDEAFACSDGDGNAQTYDGLGTEGSTASFDDMRMYVSNVRLVPAGGGDEVPVSLTQDGVWQHEDVALLDFEDGTAGCIDSGTEETNDAVVGTVPPGSYDGLVFDLAVPFELNHLDVTTAPSPLNIGAMYWAWAVGHKFFRVDAAIDGAGGFNVHLGSTMCSSDGETDPPEQECARPNRAEIRLDEFDPDADTVRVDLAALLAGSDLTSNTADTPPGCQSVPPDQDDCAAVFGNVGLDFESGACESGCADQTVFSTSP